ncbi:MAG: gamma-glutamylcyclotransferase [Halolamina sp.]
MRYFVYGTLTDPTTVGEVVDSYVFVGDAVLEGLHPVDGRYPTLAPGGETPGRLLRTPEQAALDAYEGVDDGLYVRVEIPLVGGDETGRGEVDGDESGDGGDDLGEVAVYVGDPERLDAAATWPGEAFPAAVDRYCRRNDVVVRRR